MKNIKKIKLAAMASVLAVPMVVSMLNFGNTNGRNGPKVDEKVLEEEEGNVSAAVNISLIFLTFP